MGLFGRGLAFLVFSVNAGGGGYLPIRRATNLYNMLPVQTAAQFEVLLAVIRYSREAKLVAMLASFFAGVDEWIQVCARVFLGGVSL